MNISLHQSDFCGKDNVSKFEEGQIQQLLEQEVQKVWELIIDTKKSIGSEGSCGQLVDVGCGCGDMTRILSKHFERTTGIDISPEQIVRAKEICADPSIEFLVGKGEKLPLASSSADAITAIFVIHFMDVNAFASECLRVLKPGGVAVFWADHWSNVCSVDGSKPDATHLIQDMNLELLEISQKKSHPVFYILDRHKSRFNDITVTKQKSLRSGEIDVIASLAEIKKFTLSIPFYRDLDGGSPLHTLCKRLKALWKMEEVAEEDIMLRGTRETFPIIIWK